MPDRRSGREGGDDTWFSCGEVSELAEEGRVEVQLHGDRERTACCGMQEGTNGDGIQPHALIGQVVCGRMGATLTL